MESRKKINAQITITAAYTDSIAITVHDKDSGTNFLQMVMTREQFINATMNRLAHTEVGGASLENIDRVGKKLKMKDFVFEVPKYGDRLLAAKIAEEQCPEGWLPDVYFQSQDSFFEDDDGKVYARTKMRKWVDKEEKQPQEQRELND